MKENTASKVSGQVNIADVLKILDNGIKDAIATEKESVQDGDYEIALSMQDSRRAFKWVKEQILELERKP